MWFVISWQGPCKGGTHQFWSWSGYKRIWKKDNYKTSRTGGPQGKDGLHFQKSFLDASASTRLNFPYKMDWVALAQNFWTTVYFDGWDEQLSGNMPDVSVSCLIMRSWTSSGVSDKWFSGMQHTSTAMCMYMTSARTPLFLDRFTFVKQNILTKLTAWDHAIVKQQAEKCADYRVQCGYTTVIM